MAKKDKKKKERGAVKTARKTARTEAKQDRRMERGDELSSESGEEGVEDEEDAQAILKQILQDNAALANIRSELVSSERPSPARRNFSVTANPDRADELILFGGESYNGKNVRCYNELHVLRGSDRWFSIKAANPPPPRDSHQVISYRGGLFLFGGMFTAPRDTEFLTYRDLWRLDLAEMRWEQIKATSGVPPRERCGHRMVIWKNLLVVYGGYSESSKQVQYFDDVSLFDMDTYSWTKVQKRSESKDEWPNARAGFQMALLGDRVCVYGGTFRKNGGGDDPMQVFNDMWLLHLDRDPIAWEPVKISAAYKLSARCGFSMVAFKNKVVVFGGAAPHPEDEEVAAYQNDLHMFSFETNRWHEVTHGADDVLPGCRSHAGAVMMKNNLVIMGGMFEAQAKSGKEIEVTLDDIWSVDLSKANKQLSWTQVQPVSESVMSWIGSDEDDDNEGSEEESSEEEVVVAKKKKGKGKEAAGTGLKGLCKIMSRFVADDHEVEEVSEYLQELSVSDTLSASETLQFGIHSLLDMQGIAKLAAVRLAEIEEDGAPPEGDEAMHQFDGVVVTATPYAAALGCLVTDAKAESKFLKWMCSAFQKHCHRVPELMPSIVVRLLDCGVVSQKGVSTFFSSSSQKWIRDEMQHMIQ
eukprot:TRINITY_DN18514_c0_g1_i2.p1 TRINITY_DN18514_c0_g1~~TRINITY_DN18514_c0_g1_i2.p1  ORF type:complete len:640 (+),score=185.02 TRINITY_DN18514_c0_g1_i2:138-2057(+)